MSSSAGQPVLGHVDGQDVVQMPQIEQQWAVKAYHHAETYFRMLSSMDMRAVRLTRVDDELLAAFVASFPHVDVARLDEQRDFKSDAAKARWRSFITAYEDRVQDYNFGTLLRIDAGGEYEPDNTMFVASQRQCVGRMHKLKMRWMLAAIHHDDHTFVSVFISGYGTAHAKCRWPRFFMATPTPPNKTISPAEWRNMLAQISLSHTDMDLMVMDYLLAHGYADAARQFALESPAFRSHDPPSPSYRMYAREAIRSDILAGQPMRARGKVIDLDPLLLERDPELDFALQRQHFIEFIRAQQHHEALEFAQATLAPLAEAHPRELLPQLESAMALFAFNLSSDTTSGVPNAVVSMTGDVHRYETAELVNARLQEMDGRRGTSRLDDMLKLMYWSQDVLASRGVVFPRIGDTLQRPEDATANDDPMIT